MSYEVSREEIRRLRSQKAWKEKRDQRKAEGRCPTCNDPKPEDGSVCPRCKEHRDRRKRELLSKGLCVVCGNEPAREGFQKCEVCTKINLEQAAAHRLRRKTQVLVAYGGVFCACCGEDDIRFLTIDHINGDGGEHRKEVLGSKLYNWLKQNNFPPGFQVLCYNCNCAKRDGDKCPHQLNPFYNGPALKSDLEPFVFAF